MDVDNHRLGTGRIVYMIVVLLAIPAMVLFLSGDWLWLEGWLFGIWYVVLGSSTIVYLYRHDPELLKERFRRPGTGGEKEWDRYLITIFKLAFSAWLVIMPFDAKRYGWTVGFPAWLKAAGLLMLLVSAFFLYRVFTDNPFLSPLVRIQKERKQRVISTGVYAFVRHPMYLGAVLMVFGAPMLLGSMYGMLLGAVMSLMLVLRILGEEKMLAEELDGYKEYQKKVRYRLIPYVW